MIRSTPIVLLFGLAFGRPPGASPAGLPHALAAATTSDSLAGRVVDAAGQPVAGARVSLADLQRSAVTDSTGAFTLTDVPAGWYTLDVRHPGFAACALVVEVGAGTQPLVLELRSASIEVEPITVTATRLPISSAASPLPSEALGGEALRQEHGVSLAHVLEDLPGVRSLETGEQIGKPVVRGLYGSRVLVLANGSRIEDYSWSDEDGPSVDARTAGRVEVIRGPASVLYGSDAIGGVVNVVPAPLPDAGDGPSFVKAGYEVYGASNNLEGGAVLNLAGASHALGWRVTAIGRTAGNLHTPAGELDNTGFFAVNGEAAVGLRGAHGNTALSFSHYGGEFHLLEAGGPPPPSGGADQGGPVRKADDERVQVTDDRVVSGALHLESKAQFERHSLIEVSDEGAAAGGGSGEQVAFDLLLNTTSVDILLHHGLGPVHGTVGVSGLHQDNTTSGPIALVPNARVSSGAAFAFEEIALAPAWSAVAGVRADVRHLAADSNAALGLGPESRDYTAWSGDAGLVWRPLEALSVAANVGRAWRSPNLFELFANGPLVSDDRYVIGDAGLQPEAGTDLDLSVRWQGRRVRAEVAAFRNDIARYIYLAPTGRLSLGLLPEYQYTQAHARLEGGEVSVEAAAATSLSLRAAFDAVRGTNQETGEPLPLVAPARLVLGGTWTEAQRARVGVETQIFARQTRLNPLDLSTAGHTLVDYALVNLTGGIERQLLGRAMRFDLEVSNLLNTRYRSFLSRYKAFAPDPGRDVVVRVSAPL